MQNYVIKSDYYNWMNNKEFVAIPDKYKTLDLYILFGRCDGAVIMHRKLGRQDNTRAIIIEMVNDWAFVHDEKDRMLMVKWLYSLIDFIDYDKEEWD